MPAMINDWLLFGATIIIQALAAAVVYGRFSQKIEDNSSRTVENTKALEIHRNRLDNHDVELGKMASWRDGYNAGSKSVSV
jgi:hypothetical protein